MSNDYNQRYFENRSDKKNALAISSNQSKPIDSYEQVIENYNKSLNKDDLKNVRSIGEDIHLPHTILNFGKVMNQGSIKERFLKRKMVIGHIHLFSHKYCQI